MKSCAPLFESDKALLLRHESLSLKRKPTWRKSGTSVNAFPGLPLRRSLPKCVSFSALRSALLALFMATSAHRLCTCFLPCSRNVLLPERKTSSVPAVYSGISTHVSFSLLAIPAKRVHSYIVVICVVILVLLFLAQPFGTSRIGVWTHHHAGASYDWYLADHSSPTSAPSVQPCPRLQVCVYAWE